MRADPNDRVEVHARLDYSCFGDVAASENRPRGGGAIRMDGIVRASLMSRTMTVLFVAFLLAHGLIHLLGFVKAFHFAELSQLTQDISPLFGLVWLAAALLFIGAAGSLLLWPRLWWGFSAAAVVLSMLAIIPSWSDAKFGALANALVVVGGLVLTVSRAPMTR